MRPITRDGYYDRPMVQRLLEIFEYPRPPRVVVERQFDGEQEYLEALAAKAWHEVNDGDYWCYVLDLAYVELQQDLFDYLFPPFLVLWWEWQLTAIEPDTGYDFQYSIDRGNVFEKMMSPGRREAVFRWMVDAYLDGIDRWGGHLLDESRPFSVDGPLASFNAIGQSVPITSALLDELEDVNTLGKAQWWLVLATGLLWDPAGPPMPGWYANGMEGRVFVNSSTTSIFDHGYLPQNLLAMEQRFSVNYVHRNLTRSFELLKPTIWSEAAQTALSLLEWSPVEMEQRIERYLGVLGYPNLYGGCDSPLKG